MTLSDIISVPRLSDAVYPRFAACVLGLASGLALAVRPAGLAETSGVKRLRVYVHQAPFTCTRCPAVTVTLEAGGAGTYTSRAIPGSEPSHGPCTLPLRRRGLGGHRQVRVGFPGKRGLGCPRRVCEGRRALRVRGDNTGGAADWDWGLGREPRRERPGRTTDRPSVFEV